MKKTDSSTINNPLAEKVVQLIKKNNLLSHGKKIIIAVSGGTDSVCLFHILAMNLKYLGITLHAAHLNHQLRKEESDADADYVRKLAGHFNIPVTIEERNVAEYQRQNHIPLEEAARELRYQFLAQVLNQEKASCIYTGHTLNDNAETILMNIIRGSGLNGLRGMQPLSKLFITAEKKMVPVARPLLDTTRDETEAYCKKYNLKPRQDSSNKSNDFRRNRIRHELLPLFHKYNPDFNKTLLRLAGIAGEQISYLDSIISELWQTMVTESPDAIYINRSKLGQIHPVVQKHSIRKAIERLTGTLKDIEISHVEAAIALITKPSGRSIHLPYGIRLYTEHELLVFTTENKSLVPYPALSKEFNIVIPGEISTYGWCIKTDLKIKSKINVDNPFTACLDADKTGTELIVRKRRNGDSFVPLGMKQLKKIQDFMVDEKLPRSWRSSIPLLCNQDNIIWVVGWRIDDRFKITPSTQHHLKISFERIY